MCDRHFPVVLDSTSSLNECYCQLLPWIPTESVLLESDVFSRIYCHDIYKLYELVSRGLSRDTSKIRGVAARDKPRFVLTSFPHNNTTRSQG